jgi:hypothetical protein
MVHSSRMLHCGTNFSALFSWRWIEMCETLSGFPVQFQTLYFWDDCVEFCEWQSVILLASEKSHLLTADLKTLQMMDKTVRKITCCWIFFVWGLATMTAIKKTVVGWGITLQHWKSRVRIPKTSLDFFNLPNPSSRTMTLRFTQSWTQMNTRNISALKADNLTLICEPVVWKIYYPQCLTTLQACNVC